MKNFDIHSEWKNLPASFRKLWTDKQRANDSVVAAAHVVAHMDYTLDKAKELYSKEKKKRDRLAARLEAEFDKMNAAKAKGKNK